MTLTATEIELLQKLSARREAIEKRERELDMREALAEAAEARLVAKTAELDRLQKSIQALARTHDEPEAAKIERLVTIYETETQRAADTWDERRDGKRRGGARRFRWWRER